VETQRGEKVLAEIIHEFILLPTADSLKRKRTEALKVVISFLHRNLQNLDVEKLNIVEYKNVEAKRKKYADGYPRRYLFCRM